MKWFPKWRCFKLERRFWINTCKDEYMIPSSSMMVVHWFTDWYIVQTNCLFFGFEFPLIEEEKYNIRTKIYCLNEKNVCWNAENHSKFYVHSPPNFYSVRRACTNAQSLFPSCWTKMIRKVDEDVSGIWNSRSIATHAFNKNIASCTVHCTTFEFRIKIHNKLLHNWLIKFSNFWFFHTTWDIFCDFSLKWI